MQQLLPKRYVSLIFSTSLEIRYELLFPLFYKQMNFQKSKQFSYSAML